MAFFTNNMNQKKWGALGTKLGLKEMDFLKLKNRRMFYGLHYFSFGE
jgi:hypothetical protein